MCGFKVSIFLVALVLAIASKADAWSYADTNWCAGGEMGCCGTSQSPIDLSVPNATFIKLFTPLKFKRVDKVMRGPFKNDDGHTAKFTPGFQKARLTGGPLGGRLFVMEQFHFHWGANDSIGSEHTYDGNSFPLEVHFVFRNQKYDDIGMALNHTDGLAVVGIFFLAGGSTPVKLQPISDALLNIVNNDESTTIALQLKFFLDLIDTNIYSTYPGSLTTPPCSQAVTWINMMQPIVIGDDMMSNFRSLMNGNDPLVNNFRPVQDLNDRVLCVAPSPLCPQP